MKPSLRKIRRGRKLIRFYKKRIPWCASFLGYGYNLDFHLRRFVPTQQQVHRDIYSEVAGELNVDRRDVKTKAFQIMYSPDAPDDHEKLKQKIQAMFLRDNG